MLLGVHLALPVVARDFTYQSLTYTVIDEDAKTCMTKGSYKLYGDLVIPSEVNDGKAIYKVTSIGSAAFSGRSGLTSVYYGADKPIFAYTNIFSTETYEKATLYMSEDGVVYSSMINPWKNFKNIEEYDFTTAIDDVTADFKESAPYEIYDINGVKAGDNINALSPGLYIIRQGKTVKKIAVK